MWFSPQPTRAGPSPDQIGNPGRTQQDSDPLRWWGFWAHVQVDHCTFEVLGD